MKIILNFLKNNIWLIVILAVALFLRLYKPQDFYVYNHDGDLAAWMVKDIVVNNHFRLIGQQTSVLGVFIGPLFYYLLVPFYLLFKMDPIGGVYLSAIIGISAVFSFYWVFSKIFSKKVGLIAALVYGVAFIIVITDREVVPTTPVMFCSVWILYSLYLVLKGNQLKGFILGGILAALAWHMNLALLILTPLYLVAWILSKKKLIWKYAVLGGIAFVIFSAPLILFEVKHNFQQTRTIIGSLTTERNYIPGTSKGLGKLNRVFNLASKNTNSILLGDIVSLPYRVSFILLTLMLIMILLTKVLKYQMGIIFVLWLILYMGFFTLNSLNPSEYYLNGMNVVWIGIFSVFLADFIKHKNFKVLGFVLLGFLVTLNLVKFFRYHPNQIGYRQKKELTNFIKLDAQKHNYPCVSISYITFPGYELGYRYFFYILDLHVNQPSSGSPVYTIVFPHSIVDRIDKSFGALGLILPDYSRYTQSMVDRSCSGENSNLTDPMFGYTE